MLDTVDRSRALPENCTFDPDDWRVLARCWYPVALVRDLEGKAVGATLLDRELIVFRDAEGQVIVANDQCPHRGVPLTRGRFANGQVACAYHGLRYGVGGRCVHVPAHPDADIPSRLNLIPYPAVERYGLVWTCLDWNEADPVIAPMPHWDEEPFQQIVCPTIDIFGFAGRQLEGFIDVAHFAFVHGSTFGDPDNTAVPPYTPVATDDGFEAEYWSTVGNYPIGAEQRGQPGFNWLRHFRVHLPFTATLEIHFPEGGRLVIMNAASPMSAKATRLFVPIARNFDKDMPVQAVYDFNRIIFEEDKAIVEAQRPACLPLDPLLEAHIPADRSSIAYRKGLRGLGLSSIFAR
jgi:vanillate O-demethylase monooxygenase subunit